MPYAAENHILPVGPTKCKIALVGDFPNDKEVERGQPFAGFEHLQLVKLLAAIGLTRDDVYMTKVFLEKPVYNNVEEWSATKTELKALGATTPLPPIIKNRYLLPQIAANVLPRLKAELETVKPNIIIALGPIAYWALCLDNKIAKARGSIRMSTLCPEIKVMPTYAIHMLKGQYDQLPIIVADFMKAGGASETPVNEIPERFVWVEPGLGDLDLYYDMYINRGSKEIPIGVDIETKAQQITCIGFSTSQTSAIVVPFWRDFYGDSGPVGEWWNYWGDNPENEVKALNWVAKVLRHPRPKVFQNGMYDMHYLFRCWGMKISGVIEDTMLMHHSLQPELLKGLGFLGSVYTKEPSWKGMRKTALDTEKREE